MLFKFIILFFPNFACVWCSCFGFSSLCWCARELRKSIELKYIEKQHIYRYTNAHILALPPMHAHTRSRRHTRIQGTEYEIQKKKYCLPSESVARYFRLSLLMAQQVEYIKERRMEKRDKQKTRRPIYNNSNSIIIATNNKLTTRETNTHGSCLNRFKQTSIIEN